jgi:hypothetical protein
MVYRPTGQVTDPQAKAEFEALAQASARSRPSIQLQTLHTAPARVGDGLCVLADGTNWDPGSGAGIYGYYGGAWHKLG